MDEERKNQNGNSEQDDKPDAINRLERELYAQGRPPVLRQFKHGLRKNEPQAQKTWTPTEPKKQKKKLRISPSILKRTLISSVVFAFLATAVAMLSVFLGFNRVSPDKISIEVRGVTSVEAGERISLDVSVLNRNRIPLEDVVLILEYPEETRDPEDLQRPILRQEDDIGILAPKTGRFSKVFEAVLFGSAQSVKEIKITVQYRTGEGRSVFTKEKIYKVELRSSPVSVFISALPEARSGQNIGTSVTIVSNSNFALKNAMLVAEYPDDFSFSSSNPAPTFDNRIWFLGDLEPRQRKEILINGIIVGREGEEKNFRYSVGIQNQNDERLIGTELVSQNESIFVRQPAADLSLTIDGSGSGEYVSKLGNTIRGQVNWRNNLPDDLNDVSVVLSFDGNGWDRASVLPDRRGFYRSQDNSVVWDKNTFSELLKVRAGQGGVFDFSFKINNFTARDWENLRNSRVDLEAVIVGTRLLEGRPPEEVTISSTRPIKIETNMSVGSRAVYSIGPFVNSGPLPPVAERTTTYTIIWSAVNNINDVEGFEASAVLPVYVEWLGRFSPSSADLKFDPETRIIKWSVNRLPAGQGVVNAPLEVAFQLRFSPSLSQVNKEPELVGEVFSVGRDIFTGSEVSDRKPPATIRINTDPIYSFQMGRVESP